MAFAIVLAVLIAWFVVAAGLALLIGRAARVGEVKYRDQVFLRSAAEQSRRALTPSGR